MTPDHMRGLISIITALGAFCVSGLCIVLGYKLFVAGATGAFQVTFQSQGSTGTLLSVAPGLGFALFGMFIAIFALWKLIGK